MRYDLQHGDTSWIEEQSARRGVPVPSFVADRPTVPDYLMFYQQAFFDLNTERTAGWGPGPIPWSRMKDYALYYNVKDVEVFILIISEVDKAFLEESNKSSKKKSSKKPK